MEEKSPEPGFDDPPVVEVVCGVTFDQLPISSAHVGLLWGRLGDAFPLTSDQPLLRSPVETAAGRFQVQLEADEIPRVWFMSGDEQRLVQFQRDRLYFNWRRSRTGQPYPRFPTVRDDFFGHLATLDAFLEETVRSPTRHLMYELSYLNRIPVTGASDAAALWADLLPDFSWRARADAAVMRPVDMAVELAFPLSNDSGRLVVQCRSVRRRDTGEVEFALDLTARGAAGGRTREAWFDAAHDAIVGTFVELTGEVLQRDVWKRRESR